MADDKSKQTAVDEDEERPSPIDKMKSLPRVEQISVTMESWIHEKQEHTKPPKAEIGFVLEPWTPKPKKRMVTMSDLGTDASPMGGAAARRKKS